MFTELITCEYCGQPATLWRIHTPEDECDPGRLPVCRACAGEEPKED